jgi:hypothetical protein
MIDVIQRLPEDASVERAIDELYLLAKIRKAATISRRSRHT